MPYGDNKSAGLTDAAECGWKFDLGAYRELEESLPYRSFGDTPAYRKRDNRRKDIFLWLALLKCKPEWERGNQGIGDCTSWAFEMMITLLLAMLARKGALVWEGEAATEPIYGGARVEARGGRLGGYGDGASGSFAAKFLRNWGALLRKDYSQETGNTEHNLAEYSGKKAKSWGNFGCGGRDDAGRGDGRLDQIASLFPCSIAPVKSLDEYVAAISAGFPIGIGSPVGYVTSRRNQYHNTRNADGVIRAGGSWNHFMADAGIRWRANGEFEGRNIQSWGRSVSGPDPGIDDATSYCGWWKKPQDVQKQIDRGEAFAIDGVNGFEEPVFSLDSLANADFD